MLEASGAGWLRCAVGQKRNLVGVHDHHIRAKWQDMVEVFAKLGANGFDGNGSLLGGVAFHSSFDWEKVPAYYLGDYFKARLKEDLPLNEHERTLYHFLGCYSVHPNWPSKPPSDLPVADSVVFKPERVQAIAAKLGSLDLDKALEWYKCVGPDYVTSYWPRELMQAHLRKVIDFWREAAANGEAVLHTEF